MSAGSFYPGFDIIPATDPLGFAYGNGCFGPPVELRRLDAIRSSLLEPDCEGPEIVYAIAMDVGKERDRATLMASHLLYGAVTYAAGSLGREPVRSQGHVHAKSVYARQWSTPEVYEIWQGEGIIYMQENDGDDPGRCFAVCGKPGDVIVVPPDWVHATVSASPRKALAFGAWCDRNYGFEYDGVRRHNGIAWFPLLDDKLQIRWQRNEHYAPSQLTVLPAPQWPELGLQHGIPIYTQFEENPERFLFVTRPDLFAEVWAHFPEQFLSPGPTSPFIVYSS
jgi:glucose-6-phosphate isomerase